MVPRLNATKVVVEFLGGGACWSAETCDEALADEDPVLTISTVPPALLDLDGLSATEVALRGTYVGVDFIFDDVGFDEATYVLASYCTQDAHLGTATATYRDDLVVHHNGWTNSRAVLDWVAQEFKGADITITGCSAGGLATPILAKYLEESFEKMSVISDSFAGLVSDDFTSQHLQNWGAECVFADVLNLTAPEFKNGIEMTEALWRMALEKTDIKLGAYTSKHDKSQMGQLRDMLGVIESRSDPADQARFARLALSLFDRLREDYPDTFATFIVDGDAHCGLALDVAKTHEGFNEWALKLLDHQLPASFACTNCTLDVLEGCDGVKGSRQVEQHCMTCGTSCEDKNLDTWSAVKMDCGNSCEDATNENLFETCPEKAAL